MTTMNMSSNEEHNQTQYAMGLVTASVLPTALKTAIELGVIEIIEKAGPGVSLSPNQIASHLSTQNPDAPLLLDRILRLLSAHSILTCSVSPQQHDGKVIRLYGLTPVSKYFLRNHDGGSLAPLLFLKQDKVLLDMWYHLTDAVLEGGVPFTQAYGMNMVEYAGRDARFFQVFRESMKEFNPIFMKEILERYNGFEGLTSLVDVGGGDGSVLKMILSKYPTVKGINFDLPTVVEKLPSYPGIENIAGDMFISIPKGDAIFMKWILHNLDDEHCLKILKKCREALPENGKMIVVDLVLMEAPDNSIAARSLFQFDMFMMNTNMTGKERTETEFRDLAREAGFSSIRVACCAFNFSVVEFLKST